MICPLLGTRSLPGLLMTGSLETNFQKLHESRYFIQGNTFQNTFCTMASVLLRLSCYNWYVMVGEMYTALKYISRPQKCFSWNDWEHGYHRSFCSHRCDIMKYHNKRLGELYSFATDLNCDKGVRKEKNDRKQKWCEIQALFICIDTNKFMTHNSSIINEINDIHTKSSMAEKKFTDGIKNNFRSVLEKHKGK